MRSTGVVSVALGCALSAFVCASTASAQRSPVMLELEPVFATPVTAPAIDRFLPGAGLGVAALFAPYRFLLTSVRVRAIVLGDGPAPADQRLADPGIGSLFTAHATLRVRPDGVSQARREPEATGAWGEIAIGVAYTGGLVRPSFEVGLGYAIDVGATDGAGHVNVGPVVRFVHVLQTEERGLDANSTYLVTLGVQVVLFDAEPIVTTTRSVHTRERDVVERREGVDTDHDGMDNLDDACPTEAEDIDGYQDSDGCPDLDDDGDGVPDTSDACPHDAEDVDQFEDSDGCPDPDNDADGVPDASDVCPNEPETINGIDDADGCPDQGAFALVGDRNTLELETIFAHSPAQVHESARPVLQAIVALAAQHPEWTFRVEGHGNESRDEAHNLDLSFRRATHVAEALVADGLAASRMTTDGIGSSQPRMEGHTEEAHRANCRIDIVVVQRTPPPAASVDATTGEAP